MNKIYDIETVHSSIHFRIKLLTISGIAGSFKSYSGTFERTKENWEDTKVNIAIEVASIDTGVQQRDEHLMADDWFDASNHLNITFTSHSFKLVEDDRFLLKGDLTIKGIAKPAIFKLRYGGEAQDKDGVTKTGFTGRAKIKRKDYDIARGAKLPDGSIFLSDEVRVKVDVQLREQ